MRWQRWDRAWQEALYGSGGFYRRPEGPAGHFATSAQGLPGVGEVLADAVAALLRRHELTTVLEVGAGRGELLAALTTRTDADLCGLDVVERPDDLPSRVDWVPSPGGEALPSSTLVPRALVLAHEWLDVVPAPVVEVHHDGRPRYVEVTADGEERLGDPVSAADAAWLERHWPLTAEPGRRAEVGRTRDRAWSTLASLTTGGLVVAVDYGHLADDRPPHGTLTGYRRGQQVPPVPDARCDLTAHVAVDSLPGARLRTQRAVLRELGLTGARADPDLARSDPPAYLAALARSGAGAVASAPGGLGEFWWATRRTDADDG